MCKKVKLKSNDNLQFYFLSLLSQCIQVNQLLIASIKYFLPLSPFSSRNWMPTSFVISVNFTLSYITGEFCVLPISGSIENSITEKMRKIIGRLFCIVVNDIDCERILNKTTELENCMYEKDLRKSLKILMLTLAYNAFFLACHI